MKVAVLGDGAREHALAKKLTGEGYTVWRPLYAGNPPDLSDHLEVLESLQCQKPDLVIVGPERPLIDGLADTLRQHYPVLGPGAAGAQLEGSKAVSRRLMMRLGVPTPLSYPASSHAHACLLIKDAFKRSGGAVIKQIGPALGKGVHVCLKPSEARDAAAAMAGPYLVQDYVDGTEFSMTTLMNETGFASLPAVFDYKRLLDGDRGPNTGGMGGYHEAGSVPEDVLSDVEERIVKPIWRYLNQAGVVFRGVLFSGVIMKDGCPHCLEYNVRFGDPETQTLMLATGNIGPSLCATARGEEIPRVETSGGAVVSVVLASRDYPHRPCARTPLQLDCTDPAVLTHGGIETVMGRRYAKGGRIATVSAAGETLDDARATAYRAADALRFDGRQLRGDIGSPRREV